MTKCVVCKTKESDTWTCRGDNWLCIKCSEIPTAVFSEHRCNVAVTFAGGPKDGEWVSVHKDRLFTGYLVHVRDYPHFIKYKFDWNLGFFIIDKEALKAEIEEWLEKGCPTKQV